MGLLLLFGMVLALAGAPPDTSLSCVAGTPTTPPGFSVWADKTVTLTNPICRALASVSQQRPAAAGEDGRALLIALHEANHVALQTNDECQVEKMTMAEIPGLLRHVMPRVWRAALRGARRADWLLPSDYRGC